jgi:Tfp pilus assembly protein PilE
LVVKQVPVRGVSLVEAMNLLAIVALVAAVAMLGVARYIRHAKTAEAIGAVTTLAQSAAAYYDSTDQNQPAGTAPAAARAMRHFPIASTSSVPADLDNVKRRRYKSQAAEWAVSPWKELKFSMVQPQSYAYRFAAEGAGRTANARAQATGDLDGDGRSSLFSLRVSPDPSLNAVVAAEVEIKDANE